MKTPYKNIYDVQVLLIPWKGVWQVLKLYLY